MERYRKRIFHLTVLCAVATPTWACLEPAREPAISLRTQALVDPGRDERNARARQALASLLSSIPAPTPLPTTSDPKVRMSRMLQRRMQRPLVSFNKYGTIRTLYLPRGALANPTGAQAVSFEQAARAFVGARPDLLAMTSRDDLVLQRVRARRGGGATVRFAVRRDGVTVIDGHVVVILDATRSVVGLMAKVLPSVGPSHATPAVAAAVAKSVAMRSGDKDATVNLRWADQPRWTSPRLVWRVEGRDQTGMGWHALVDAQGGTLLGRSAHVKSAYHYKLGECTLKRRALRQPHDHSRGRLDSDEQDVRPLLSHGWEHQLSHAVFTTDAV